ncbi:MAG: glycosyltransferase family 1 protein [Elusimicrobia bacterium]|nr:glycosyltransferase family 1 protein [Elusimicrobiota bacterium]
MRIALEITGALAGGGFRRHTEMIIRALAAEDKKNEYILYGAFWSKPERVHQLDLPRQANFKIEIVRAPQSLLLPAEEYLGLRWQERRLRRLGVDMVHGFSNWLPKLDRLPSLLTLAYATDDRFSGWHGFYFNTLLPRSARQADKVLAISGVAREAAIRNWGLDPKKVEVVYLGASLDEFKPDDSPRDPAEKPYFLFVGVTRRTKNTKVLMEAFVLFKKRHPEAPHRFVICGAPGDEQAELEDLLARAGLTGAVTFAGGVEQSKISPFYQKALAYVSASTLEGFHIPLAEAMACGIPTVAARGGAQTEIVADAGLHVDATAEDLARGMEAVAFDAGLRASLIAKGFERCKDFSWKTAARKTIAAYEEVHAARR